MLAQNTYSPQGTCLSHGWGGDGGDGTQSCPSRTLKSNAQGKVSRPIEALKGYQKEAEYGGRVEVKSYIPQSDLESEQECWEFPSWCSG